MKNLEIYDALRTPPADALKKIMGGRMAGKSDISPQWRIEALTAQFGAVGFGWYFDVIRQWSEVIEGETLCFVNIQLFVKVDNEWSKPIFGTGGNKLATIEKSGIYVSDEGYKMALTDAISVAAKSLGVAADVYRGGEPTKYNKVEDNTAQEIADLRKRLDSLTAKATAMHEERTILVKATEAMEGIEKAKEVASNFPSLKSAKGFEKYF